MTDRSETRIDKIHFCSFLGVLFSNVYLLEAVCSLGAATLFNNIYDQTLSIYNGLVFFVMAGVSTVAVLLLM